MGLAYSNEPSQLNSINSPPPSTSFQLLDLPDYDSLGEMPTPSELELEATKNSPEYLEDIYKEVKQLFRDSQFQNCINRLNELTDEEILNDKPTSLSLARSFISIGRFDLGNNLLNKAYLRITTKKPIEKLDLLIAIHRISNHGISHSTSPTLSVQIHNRIQKDPKFLREAEKEFSTLISLCESQQYQKLYRSNSIQFHTGSQPQCCKGILYFAKAVHSHILSEVKTQKTFHRFLDYCEKAEQSDPSLIEDILLLKSAAAFNMNDFSSNEIFIKHLIQANIKNSIAFTFAGLYAFRKATYFIAIAYFKESLDLNKYCFISIICLAISYSKILRRQLALETSQICIDRFPCEPDSYVYHSQLLWLYGLQEKAIQTIQIAIDNPTIPPTAKLYILLSDYYKQKMCFFDAMRVLFAGETRCPKSGEILVQITNLTTEFRFQTFFRKQTLEKAIQLELSCIPKHSVELSLAEASIPFLNSTEAITHLQHALFDNNTPRLSRYESIQIVHIINNLHRLDKQSFSSIAKRILQKCPYLPEIANRFDRHDLPNIFFTQMEIQIQFFKTLIFNKHIRNTLSYNPYRVYNDLYLPD